MLTYRLCHKYYQEAEPPKGNAGMNHGDNCQLPIDNWQFTEHRPLFVLDGDERRRSIDGAWLATVRGAARR